MNINFMAYGSTGSGKTTVIEGNKKEPGIVMMYVSNLFEVLQLKRQQLNSDPNSKVHSYSYELEAQFVEIIDE
jgi:Kinesin motor domain